ncbi:MAG: alpha/beta fold hydrolase [Actinomycetota bacterium]
MPMADLGDIKIHYSVNGEGPPVLGIMGFSLDKRFWSITAPAIVSTHRFITFDNRGVGYSTGPVVGTVDEMANDTIRLMDHLELEDAIVFGVSMGGTIAQRIALDHPERVTALILAVTWSRPIEYMRRNHELAQELTSVSGAEGLLQASLLRMFTPRFFEVGREAIDQMVASLDAPGGPEATSVEVLAGQLAAIDKFDALGELPQIDCPTLVLGGKMDMMVPGFASEEIAAAIPGADLKMFETGHGCMVEEMEAFNQAVAGFLHERS